MKDYIEKIYPESVSYDLLRKAVKMAWNKIGVDVLKELIAIMS